MKHVGANKLNVRSNLSVVFDVDCMSWLHIVFLKICHSHFHSLRYETLQLKQINMLKPLKNQPGKVGFSFWCMTYRSCYRSLTNASLTQVLCVSAHKARSMRLNSIAILIRRICRHLYFRDSICLDPLPLERVLMLSPVATSLPQELNSSAECSPFY
jgi:hypothetical protein